MMTDDATAVGLALLCFAVVWVPARRGHLWARFVAWGAIVFVLTVLIRMMRSGYTSAG